MTLVNFNNKMVSSNSTSLLPLYSGLNNNTDIGIKLGWYVCLYVFGNLSSILKKVIKSISFNQRKFNFTAKKMCQNPP